MTYKEYFTMIAGRINIEPTTISYLYESGGVSPDDTMDIKHAKMILYKEFPLIAPIYTSISEGGLSYSYDRDRLMMWYTALCDELGLPNKFEKKTIITDKSDMW